MDISALRSVVQAPANAAEEAGMAAKTILASVGLRSVQSRFLAGGGVSYALLAWWKPPYFYQANGARRPWSVTSDATNAVLVTPEMAALFVAFIFGNI